MGSAQDQQWLLAGLEMSLFLWGITLILAVPLALLVALLRSSAGRFRRVVGTVYVQSVRNVPLLAHMLFWYFAAPELLPEGPRQWLYAGNIEAISAVAALTVYTAAYMSEDIRSGIRAVPEDQAQAGLALGLRPAAVWRRVVLPQAMRAVAPPLISQTLNLWKNTSLATVIGVGELMYQAARVESASSRSVEAFTFATVSYLGVSLLISAAATLCARRFPVRLR